MSDIPLFCACSELVGGTNFTVVPVAAPAVAPNPPNVLVDCGAANTEELPPNKPPAVEVAPKPNPVLAVVLAPNRLVPVEVLPKRPVDDEAGVPKLGVPNVLAAGVLEPNNPPLLAPKGVV